jgi:hypothetical protein
MYPSHLLITSFEARNLPRVWAVLTSLGVHGENGRWLFSLKFLQLCKRKIFYFLLPTVDLMENMEEIMKVTLYYLDGWTEHLAVPFVKRPTNAQGSSGCFINTFQISTPTCFGIWLPSSGGRECLISYSSNVLCYGRVRIVTGLVWPVVVERCAPRH